MNVSFSRHLISLVEVSRMDRVGNEDVHRRAGIEMVLMSRVDQRY